MRGDEMRSQDKLWRTLVRVTGIQKDGVWLCIPGWNSDVSVLRPPSIFAPKLAHFVPVISVGQRFFAQVNVGADDPDDLRFEDFEFVESEEEE
jgi:hypothetical protein